MIRLVLLFFLTSFLKGDIAQKQDIISITYKKKIVQKQIDDVLINKKRIDLQNKFEEIEYSLEFNDNISIFKIVETLESDFNRVNNNFAQTVGGTELQVITQLDKDEKYYTTSLFNEPYIVYDKTKNLNWEIEKETKNILGYNCQKAKTVIKIDDFRGKQQFEVIAWFTKQIPSSFGPSVFNGLPGTILEIHYGDIITYAVKVKTQKGIIKPPNIEGTKVSSKEFISIFNKKMNAIRQN